MIRCNLICFLEFLQIMRIITSLYSSGERDRILEIEGIRVALMLPDRQCKNEADFDNHNQAWIHRKNDWRQ
jgi:hypothetical protein